MERDKVIEVLEIMNRAKTLMGVPNDAITQAISMIKENAELYKELDKDLYPYSHGCDKHDYQWQDNRKKHVGSEGCYACLQKELTELKANIKQKAENKALYE